MQKDYQILLERSLLKNFLKITRQFPVKMSAAGNNRFVAEKFHFVSADSQLSRQEIIIVANPLLPAQPICFYPHGAQKINQRQRVCDHGHHRRAFIQPWRVIIQTTQCHCHRGLSMSHTGITPFKTDRSRIVTQPWRCRTIISITSHMRPIGGFADHHETDFTCSALNSMQRSRFMRTVCPAQTHALNSQPILTHTASEIEKQIAVAFRLISVRQRQPQGQNKQKRRILSAPRRNYSLRYKTWNCPRHYRNAHR